LPVIQDLVERLVNHLQGKYGYASCGYSLHDHTLLDGDHVLNVFSRFHDSPQVGKRKNEKGFNEHSTFEATELAAQHSCHITSFSL
jgi:hypothetical protein